MTDSLLISQCLELMEQKLRWGESKGWTDGDFQKLSEEVHAASGISISIPTLKRLFGRKKIYSEAYNPQLETKNALVIFLGYQDWQHFKTSRPAPADRPPPEPAPPADGSEQAAAPEGPARQAAKRRWVRAAGVSGLLVLVLGSVFGYFQARTGTPYSFTFEGKHVKGPIPLTAVFSYDISEIKTDSVFIFYETGYNVKRRLPKDKHTVTQWYELPGLYRVKLLADGQVLASHNVHVTSSDWVTVVLDEQHGSFVRVAAAADSGGTLSAPAQAATALPNAGGRYWVQHRLAQDFGVDGDAFAFEVRARNNAQQEAVRCNDLVLELHGEHHKVRLQFLEPGCTRWAMGQVGEVELNGEFNDLSAFGQDISRWRTIRLEVREGEAKVYVEDKLVYAAAYREPIGEIKAIVLETLFAGTFDYVRLYDERQKVAFADDFRR